MHKKAKLKEIVKCCQARFGHGVSASWKHSDFNNLSREILRATGVILSPNTLKRIFGKIAVDNDYLPQQATIEALEKYGGYTPDITSQPIQSTQFKELVPEQSAVVDFQPNDTGILKPRKLSRYKSILLILFFVFFFGAWVFKILTSKSKLLGNIALTSTEGTLPSTAFFRLQLPESGDSFFVNFGDKSALVYVKTGEQNIAHKYLFPGVFTVSLQKAQQVLATARICIFSNKWIGLGFHRQRDLPDHYYEFPVAKFGPDSLFHITNNQLHNAGLDTTGSVYTRLCNFTPVSGDSDNFVFETTFKNDCQKKGIYCTGTQFQISGLNNMIRFKMVSPGCSFGVFNVVSEKKFNGAKSNLSQFVADLEKWNTVKLVDRNKQVSLFVNGRLVFNDNYQKPLGQIKGLFIEFEGNGFVKSCDLQSEDGKSWYHF